MRGRFSMSPRSSAWRRRLLVAAIISVVALIVAPSLLHAALWVRISIAPNQPSAGEPVHVRVQTVVVWEAQCLDDPSADVTPIAAYTGTNGATLDMMQLAAIGPDPGTPLLASVIRREDDPTMWEGSIVFPAAGPWTLRMARPYWPVGSGTCTGAEIQVTVLAAGTPEATPQAATPHPFGFHGNTMTSPSSASRVMARRRQTHHRPAHR